MSKKFDLAQFLKSLKNVPGVYLMLDADDTVIYVGKACYLKERVASYSNSQHNDRKTRAMVSHIASIEVTVTQTEKEALLLESNLIKKHSPHYNVVFRDDKSYPFIYISADTFPRITLHRGAQSKKGHYFGPYPSMGAVRTTLNLLQKVFPFRTCDSHFFNNRTRPCLQYQIKRCSAPCVNYINTADYAEDIVNISQFLQGKSEKILNKIAQQMDQASHDLAFEKAARWRDQLEALRQLQQQQYITTGVKTNTDVIAIAGKGELYCVQVMMVRNGSVLAGKPYYPKPGLLDNARAVLQAFVAQYYTTGIGAKNLPDAIIIDQNCEFEAALADVLQEAKHKLPQWVTRPRTQRLQWLNMARRNAVESLAIRLARAQTIQDRLQAFQQAFALDAPPKRIECFDISHSQGESTVAACVVCDHQGTNPQQYRRFNIKDITAGDDYAAMQQALTRRYQALQMAEKTLPDVVLIDGGKGQLRQAITVFDALNIHNVLLIGVAKGETRKPGLEQLWLPNAKLPKILDATDPALHLIQAIRDEAHRFAISGHRRQRDKKRRTSPLEHITGIGSKKRQALIRHFGGWRGVKHATPAELSKVDGIGEKLAVRVHAALSDYDLGSMTI